MNRDPTLVVSLDFELGWGVIEGGLWRKRERAGVYRNTRGAVRDLVACCDDLDLPLTWATVGAMIEDPARVDLDHLPADLRDQSYAALRAAEPATFDGRDVFDVVKRARVTHDVGGHGYAHVRYDYPGVDAACVMGDIERLISVLQHHPRSFVYPRNREGYADLIAAAGFGCIRGVPRPARGGRIGRAAAMVALPPPLSEVGEPLPGLCRTTFSHLFNAGHDQRWRVGLAAWRARRGLARCQLERGLLHIFTHPYDLGALPPLSEAFRAFLRAAADMRDRGQLTIRTMADLAPAQP